MPRNTPDYETMYHHLADTMIALILLMEGALRSAELLELGAEYLPAEEYCKNRKILKSAVALATCVLEREEAAAEPPFN